MLKQLILGGVLALAMVVPASGGTQPTPSSQCLTGNCENYCTCWQHCREVFEPGSPELAACLDSRCHPVPVDCICPEG